MCAIEVAGLVIEVDGIGLQLGSARLRQSCGARIDGVRRCAVVLEPVRSDRYRLILFQQRGQLRLLFRVLRGLARRAAAGVGLPVHDAPHVGLGLQLLRRHRHRDRSRVDGQLAVRDGRRRARVGRRGREVEAILVDLIQADRRFGRRFRAVHEPEVAAELRLLKIAKPRFRMNDEPFRGAVAVHRGDIPAPGKGLAIVHRALERGGLQPRIPFTRGGKGRRFDRLRRHRALSRKVQHARSRRRSIG